jgi:hypothetical protein
MIQIIIGLAMVSFSLFGGYRAGVAFTTSKYETAINKELISKQNHINNLIELNKVINDEYNAKINEIIAAERIAARNTIRVQQLTSEIKALTRTASATSVRDYADGVTELYTACRNEYQDLGYEAARTAAAASALKSSLEAQK